MGHENKLVARRFYDELWNQGIVHAADDFVSEAIVDHTPLPGRLPGLEGFKQLVTMIRIAFPDLYIAVDDVIAEGDKVVCLWTASGTHEGALLGLAPSHEHMTIDGIDVLRLEKGKIVEHWGKIDVIGLLQQLDMLPHLQAAEA